MVVGPIEFLIGGMAACGAGFFTNPLEVAKTRMQLQGELLKKGNYPVHYKNVAHAFYKIASVDGFLALQNGLVPALLYQLSMNGIRLGVYECFDSWGLIRDSQGQLSTLKSIVAAGLSGCAGSFIGSPFFLVKVQLQAMAAKDIAVGHQHNHHSMREALKNIYIKHGVYGLWRGVGSAVPRVMVGSASQLTSFSYVKQKLTQFQIVKEKSSTEFNWKLAFLASSISGVVVTLFMTPFDVVSTRIYNQNILEDGRGTVYKGVGDCFLKIFRSEGLWGFYKGWGASWFRIGPHTVLTLLFWEKLKSVAAFFSDHELR